MVDGANLPRPNNLRLNGKAVHLRLKKILKFTFHFSCFCWVNEVYSQTLKSNRHILCFGSL